MLDSITAGRFLPGNSYIHRLDPRTKMLAALVLIWLVFNANNAVSYLFTLLVTAMAVALSGFSLSLIMKGLKPFLWIIVLTVLVQIFLMPGTPLVSLKFFTLSREGLINSIVVGLRLIFAVIITNLLIMTTSPMLLMDGLERIFKPLKKIKVPVSELALMITITIRFIPTLLEEAEKIMKAQSSRGAGFDTGSIFTRGKYLVSLLVPLLVSSLRRADELAMAMESRGYNAGNIRTRMNPIKLGRQDAIVALTIIFILVLFYFIN